MVQCNHIDNSDVSTTHKFSTDKYKRDAFNKRVQTFLEKESKLYSKITYILILNTGKSGNCASCVKSSFTEHLKNLHFLDKNLLIITNESEFLWEDIEKDSFQFEKYPFEVFENYDVIHRKAYLYEIDNGAVVSSKLLDKNLISHLKTIDL